MNDDYLVNFKLSNLPTVKPDLLILGSGVAGLTAALAAARDRRVLVVTKGTLAESTTAEAQGGIAVALSEADDWRDHLSDTLIAGDGLCRKGAVEVLVREGPAAVRELIARGAQFDQEDGRLSFTREGAHGRNRVIHAQGDATGREVARALIHQAKDHPRIEVWEKKMAIDLLQDGERCRGALLAGRGRGKQAVLAAATVMATGGIGRLYRETTNPAVTTGDGMAMADRAGAALTDMEFIQFHPTTLYLAGAPRFLISESVRGEGGILRNKKGERFMSAYHPQAELAPRDVVSRAIVDQIRGAGADCVYLDVRHLPADLLKKRFPSIRALLEEYGLDLLHDLIPIRPAAHYMMGGIKSDLEGRTTLPGLYACGEVACTGLHGANRLASNSLLEGLVFGERAGAAASRELAKVGTLRLENLQSRSRIPRLDIEDVRRSLKSLLWRFVGIERRAEELEEAMRRILFWKKYVLGIQFSSPSGWVLQNMLVTAEWIVEGALQRKESRGGHFRLDYPARDDQHWKKHIVFQKPR